MITREGMETALLMNALLFQIGSFEILAGAIAGIVAAAAVAVLWSRYGHRVNLASFFQVTAIFLLVFVVQLLIYGFHELTEANVLPYSQPLHWATEPYGPDGQYGQYFTYLLVVLPLGWLAFFSAEEQRTRSRRGAGGMDFKKPPLNVELEWEGSFDFARSRMRQRSCSTVTARPVPRPCNRWHSLWRPVSAWMWSTCWRKAGTR